MNNRIIIYSILALAAITVLSAFVQQSVEPWKPDQLLAPLELANKLNNPQSPQPIIYSIGPGAVIKNSIDIGSTRQVENLNKLKEQLSKLPKDVPIVIYCGCCPFNKCPNIRPAFSLLNEMHFTNHKLLNLTQNVKANWIDQGYPINE